MIAGMHGEGGIRTPPSAVRPSASPEQAGVSKAEEHANNKY